MAKALSFQLAVVLSLVAGCSESDSPSTAQTMPANQSVVPAVDSLSSEPSDASAQCLLAMKYRGGIEVQQDDVLAAKWFQRAAEQGNATAQFFMGVICFDGCGVEQDQGAGLRWTRLAAEQGESRAQFNLAVSYFKGQGVVRDSGEAAKWFRRAAEQGHVQAQAILGNLLADGIGVSQDKAAAAEWFLMSAASGVPESAHNAGNCFWHGEGVEKSLSEAFKWYRKAAESGIALSQLAVASQLHGGLGVPADLTEAARWYRLAAEQGNSIAQFQLGWLYSNGMGVQRDDAVAASWFTKAAGQGSAEAQYNLARCYKLGLGLPQDDLVAAQWYLRAADQGFGLAQLAMSIVRAEGSGVSQDNVSAYAWANLAAANGVPKAKELRDFLVGQMTRQEVADGQKLAREFRPRAGVAEDTSAFQLPAVEVCSTGSGFFISRDGAFVTNHHVVVEARRIRVQTKHGVFNARVLRADPTNDLAVLQVDLAASSQSALPLCSSSALRVSDRVATIGFPNPVLQGLTAKYSSGEVAALSGPSDDPSLIQVSTPLQPGNSGGPLFDSAGCVVGVVVGQLDKLATFERTGSLPENVNYAVKGAMLLALVESVPGLVDRLQPPHSVSRETRWVPDLVEPACGLVLVER
jgi:TPR repeat protein